MCKGPELGTCLVCPRESKEVHVAELRKALGGSLRIWAFSLRERESQGRAISSGGTPSNGFSKDPARLKIRCRSRSTARGPLQ